MKKSSKIRTKSNSRFSSKHQLDSSSRSNVTTAASSSINKRNSRRQSSTSNRDSKVVSAEVEEEDDLEEEEEGEENDEQLGDEELLTLFNNEKEAIVKLCQKIVENFWDSAWFVCSERFYFGNAPCMIALELRNTWLRIIEAQWMDHDQNDLPSNMFVPDEPPMPLLFESPSTDLFLQSRFKDETVEEVSAGGEPQATNAAQQMGKKNNNIMDNKQNATKTNKRDKSESNKKIFFGKKTTPSKIPVIKKTKGGIVGDKNTNKSSRVPIMKKKTFNNTTNNNKVRKEDQMDDTKSVETVKVEGSSVANNEPTENSAEAGVVLPINDLFPAMEDNNNHDNNSLLSGIPDNLSLEVEVPWDVIFMSKYKLDDDDLSPSMSQEYRFLGIVPWSPVQCEHEPEKKNSGVFRFFHETSIFANQRVEHEHQQQQQRLPIPSIQNYYYPQPPRTPPPLLATQKLSSTDGNSSNEKETVDKSNLKVVTTGLSIKKGSILLETTTGVDSTPLEPPPSRIVERIDNLLDADSDHVVDILRPTEAGPVYSAGSQEFNAQGIEFAEHFSKPDNRVDAKSEGKTSMDKKPKFRSNSTKVDKGKKAQVSHNIASKTIGSDSDAGKMKNKSPKGSVTTSVKLKKLSLEERKKSTKTEAKAARVK